MQNIFPVGAKNFAGGRSRPCSLVTGLTRSVTQKIRGVTKRLLRAPQRMLGSCMRLLDLEQCLKTIVQQVTPRLPATMSQP